VRAAQVNALAIEFAREERRKPKTFRGSPARINGKGDYSTLDIVAWLSSLGLYLRPIGPGVHAVRCPWSEEHSLKGWASSTVVFENAGRWPGFHCHHSHCEGRTVRDVMALLGGMDEFCRESFKRAGR